MLNFLIKSNQFTSRSEAHQGMLRVDIERHFLTRFKNRGLAPPKVSKGFTLIEILIALIILSFSLLALAGLMVTTTKNNSFGSHITEAATLAQDKLEEFRAVRPQAPPLGDIPDGLGTDKKAGATGINYTRDWNVVTNGNLRTITITITWNDRINHSIKLLSVLSQ